TGGQGDKRAAVYGADAKKSPLRVRDRQPIGRKRTGRIAVPDRTELMRVGNPGQAALPRPLRRRAARDEADDDGAENQREKECRASGRPLHATDSTRSRR